MVSCAVSWLTGRVGRDAAAAAAAGALGLRAAPRSQALLLLVLLKAASGELLRIPSHFLLRAGILLACLLAAPPVSCHELEVCSRLGLVRGYEDVQVCNRTVRCLRAVPWPFVRCATNELPSGGVSPRPAPSAYSWSDKDMREMLLACLKGWRATCGGFITLSSACCTPRFVPWWAATVLLKAPLRHRYRAGQSWADPRAPLGQTVGDVSLVKQRWWHYPGLGSKHVALCV